MISINIQFTSFCAFYTPLLATDAAGFLKDEGLEPHLAICEEGESAIDALLDGSAHVAQSAPAQGLGSLEKGAAPGAVHFAQINKMDGFFLTGRTPEPDFSWAGLAGRTVIVTHGAQPLAMFKYACKRQGLDYAAIDAIDAGKGPDMDAMFRAGKGDYIHQQGPAPQQLAADGVGYVVASVGQAIGPCAFSSLAATREWLAGDMALAFMRAYRKTRLWLNEAPAAEIAAAEKEWFPSIDAAVLANCIGFYQTLGCWVPDVEITREAFDVTLDVFRNVGRDHPSSAYDSIVVPPPGS